MNGVKMTAKLLFNRLWPTPALRCEGVVRLLKGGRKVAEFKMDPLDPLLDLTWSGTQVYVFRSSRKFGFDAIEIDRSAIGPRLKSISEWPWTFYPGDKLEVTWSQKGAD